MNPKHRDPLNYKELGQTQERNYVLTIKFNNNNNNNNIALSNINSRFISWLLCCLLCSFSLSSLFVHFILVLFYMLIEDINFMYYI